MSRRPSPSDFFYELPRNQWFKLPEQIEKLHPELGENDRKILMSSMATYISRRIKWGETAKSGKRGRMLYCV